jgi:large subunit ribosomal protein L21
MPKKNETEVKVNFAVVEVTGNQYIVEPGKTYSVKKLDGVKGDKYTCDKVLMVVDGEMVVTGKPYVDGAKVEFEITSQTKGEKVDSFKYTAKSRVRKRSGSRALITKLSVKKIVTK